MLLQTVSEAQLNSISRTLKKDLDVNLRLHDSENHFTRIEITGELRRRQKAAKVLLGELDKPWQRRRSRSRSPVQRVAINVAVPKALVGRLIGRSGENVKMLKWKCGAHINFVQQDLKEMKTADGGEARACTLSGRPEEIAQGVRLLWEQILKFESLA